MFRFLLQRRRVWFVGNEHAGAPGTDRRLILRLTELEDRTALDDNSVGPDGIDARNLVFGGPTLTGSGIHIGQVEEGRAGMPGYDRPIFVHPDVRPHAVYRLEGLNLAPDTRVTTHATNVAGVMIANGPADKGVAPLARLHSVDNGKERGGFRENHLLALQQIAGQNNDDIPAVNVSYNFSVQSGGAPDGSSLLSVGFDFLARKHNTVIVQTRGNSQNGADLPADSYNPLVVGGVERVGLSYTRVSPGTILTPGAADRRLIQRLSGAAVSC